MLTFEVFEFVNEINESVTTKMYMVVLSLETGQTSIDT